MADEPRNDNDAPEEIPTTPPEGELVEGPQPAEQKAPVQTHSCRGSCSSRALCKHTTRSVEESAAVLHGRRAAHGR